MSVGIDEKVYKVRGQRSRSWSDGGIIHFDTMASRVTCFFTRMLLSKLAEHPPMLQIYQMLIPVLNLKNSHNCFNELSPKFYAGGGGSKSTKLHCIDRPRSPLSHRLFEMKEFIYMKFKTNPMQSNSPNLVHLTMRVRQKKVTISLEIVNLHVS